MGHDQQPDQNDDQGGDGQGGLHRPESGLTAQTLVFRARAMIPLSAVTIESPVTTV